MRKFENLGLVVLLFCSSIWGAPYTDNGNGTVKDSATGLVWQKCIAGQSTTLGDCSTGSISSYTWLGAIAYCEGLTLGGSSDWRLPNINELGSIINYTKSISPTIDTTVFSNPQSEYYWSSNTYAQNTSNAWYIDFTYGNVHNYNKTDGFYVRCVTGP